MFRGISVAILAFCIAACASSGTEEQVSADATGSEEEPSMTVTHDPDGPQVMVSKEAAAENDPNEIICRRETPTGSKMSRRVCRTRAEIDERAQRDQDALNDSRATQTGGDCALNQNC